MIDTEAKIIEILQKLPSEGPNLDYKEMPYKQHDKLAFIKDVIAMLNAEAAMDKDKFIIFGVEDKSRQLKGIEEESWRDDNEWQNLLLKKEGEHLQTIKKKSWNFRTSLAFSQVCWWKFGMLCSWVFIF